MSVNNLIFELGLVWIEALAFRLSRVTHHCQKTLKPCAVLSHLVMSDSLWPYRPQPSRLLRPWDYPGKNTGVGCHVLLQGIFPTQGSNSCLPHLLNCRRILHYWTTKETLSYYTWEENKNISHSTCENEDQILHIKGIESHILNVVYVALIAGVTHFCDSCH